MTSETEKTVTWCSWHDEYKNKTTTSAYSSSIVATTQRLQLRRIDPDIDAQFMFDLYHSDTWTEQIGKCTWINNIDESRQFIVDKWVKMQEEHNCGCWILSLRDAAATSNPETAKQKKDDAEPADSEKKSKEGEKVQDREDKAEEVKVGICGLNKRDELKGFFDLGFALLPAFEGKGYAYEASQVPLLYAREVLQQKELLAITDEANKRSSKLLERLGFSHKDGDDVTTPTYHNWIFRRQLE